MKLAIAQCPPLPRDSADRGGAVGGGVNGLWLWAFYVLFGHCHVSAFVSHSAMHSSNSSCSVLPTYMRILAKNLPVRAKKERE